MDKAVTVEYTEELVRSSVFRYWANLLGLRSFFVLMIIGIFSAFLFITGVDSWFIGFISACFVILTGIYIFSFFRLMSISLDKFRRLKDSTATFRFTDETIFIEAEMAKMEISWQLVEKILQYPEFWLIIVSGSYMTLPTKSLDDELKNFILKKTSLKP